MDYILNKKKRTPLLLSADELAELEAANPEGLSSAEIVEVFSGRGIKFSEATFRKYVQQGLLPRSRRVGAKGKHKGSRGVYPVGTLRQINEIKRMMSFDYTIEDIRQRFAFIGGETEELRRLIGQILEKFEQSIGSGESGDVMSAGLKKQIEEAKRSADLWVDRLEAVAVSLREQAQLARDAV